MRETEFTRLITTRWTVGICKEIVALSRTIGSLGGGRWGSSVGIEHGLYSVAFRHLSCGRISLVFGRESIFREGPRRLTVKRSVIDRRTFFRRDFRRYISILVDRGRLFKLTPGPFCISGRWPQFVNFLLAISLIVCD